MHKLVVSLACLASACLARRLQPRSIDARTEKHGDHLNTEPALAFDHLMSAQQAQRSGVLRPLTMLFAALDAGSRWHFRSHFTHELGLLRPIPWGSRVGLGGGAGGGGAGAGGGDSGDDSEEEEGYFDLHSKQWSVKQLFDAIKNNLIKMVSFSSDGKKVFFEDRDGNHYEAFILPEQRAELTKLLQTKNIAFTVLPPAHERFKDWSAAALIGWRVLKVLLGAVSGPAGAPNDLSDMRSPGSAAARPTQLELHTGVTFADVAGADDAKLELTEVVDFLKDPTKYEALGARIPKGVIMEGPPGTGKTLLARAVAGEAGVPFIATSGSEFVELYVGAGARRVRALFEQARRMAPCIIFIDEIDAVGKQRGGRMGGPASDEREQTLNQILTEMDGFKSNTSVIVIAATNRADVLDHALTRPGRFDRRVPVDLPDVKGRLEILQVHAKGKPLAPELDLSIVARRTIGFSGADLANLMNEAAIIAARHQKGEVGYEQIDYALDRATMGMQKATGTSFPERQRLVAYHEAGHAVMGMLTPNYDMVTKVTILPRSNGAGGFTLFTPSEERLETGMYSRRYLCGQLAVALGGRVAEEIIFGKDEVTTGASSDLQTVREVAHRMVAQWGFAHEAMGEAPVAWETPEGNSLMSPRAVSAETEKEIDDQVKIIVNTAYLTAHKILTENRALLDALAQKLLEEETVDYEQLQQMRETYLESTSGSSAEQV